MAGNQRKTTDDERINPSIAYHSQQARQGEAVKALAETAANPQYPNSFPIRAGRAGGSKIDTVGQDSFKQIKNINKF